MSNRSLPTSLRKPSFMMRAQSSEQDQRRMSGMTKAVRDHLLQGRRLRSLPIGYRPLRGPDCHTDSPRASTRNLSRASRIGPGLDQNSDHRRDCSIAAPAATCSGVVPSLLAARFEIGPGLEQSAATTARVVVEYPLQQCSGVAQSICIASAAMSAPALDQNAATMAAQALLALNSAATMCSGVAIFYCRVPRMSDPRRRLDQRSDHRKSDCRLSARCNMQRRPTILVWCVLRGSAPGLDQRSDHRRVVVEDWAATCSGVRSSTARAWVGASRLAPSTDKRDNHKRIVVVCRCKVQSSQSMNVARLGVGASLDEQGNCRGTASTRRTVERCPFILVPRLRVGTGLDKYGSRSGNDLLRRPVEWCPVILVARIGASAGIEQFLHGGGSSGKFRYPVERCDAIAVPRHGIGTSRQAIAYIVHRA